MDADTFTDLALRVIAGEATVDERATLERELSADASLRAEFDELALTFNTMRTAAPMNDASLATTPELPAHRVHELRSAVRRHFGPLTAVRHTPMLDALRWLFAGGGLAGLAVLIVLLCLSNRTIEVGSYTDDLVRNGDHPLTQADLPSAKFLTFDKDADFDAWQSQPLAWYERGKIWVDNEHDLLHIVKRVGHGEVISETQPLATSDDPQRAEEAQRAQIQQAVQSLSR
jgi:hypothetical protein